MQLSFREVLALSPEARKEVKDRITSRKVPVHGVTEEAIDIFLETFLQDHEPTVLSLNLDKYDPATATAAHSLPLRSIQVVFGDSVEAECLLDGGAEVVVMDAEIWEQLQLPLSSRGSMVLESSNSTKSSSVGVVKDMKATIGDISFYLQVQVVENAPFEVLLGRPFFDVMNCTEVSRAGGHHHITYRRPGTTEEYVLATQPRKSRKPLKKAAVNFRA